MTKKKVTLIIALAAVIMSVAIILSLNVLAESGSDKLAGDATGDGVVDTRDLILIRKYLAWYNYETGESSIEINANADMNGDGKIDVVDLSKMRDMFVNGVVEEPVQDNCFDGEDFYAAYKYNTPDGVKGELLTENGMTFFRATATASKDGKLVLNSGENTVEGVGKQFVLVYRNKTASISRVNIGINAAGKTNNSDGAAPYIGLTRSNEWQVVYFSTSTPVDLTNGAGYISIDLFSTNNSGNVVTSVGDVMDIALFAAVDSKETAEKAVYDYCGKVIKLPYTVMFSGIYLYGDNTVMKGVDVFPNTNAATTDKPTEIDLSAYPIGGNLKNALRIGSGWAITKEGWDHFEYRIIESNGNTKTLHLHKGNNLGQSTLNALSNYISKYGENMGIGGSIADKLSIDLTGYEGKTVTVEICGISNYGAEYKLANIKNVQVLGLDNAFTAHDFYIAYKNITSPKYTGELVYENGISFFRATATEADFGRITLNSGTKAVENFGKSYILVYRNQSQNANQKFQLYVTPASGASDTMIPAFIKENTSEWKIAVLNYNHALDMSAGAKSINVDLFFNNGQAGDVIDVALFAGAENEAELWEIFARELGDKIDLPYAVNIDGIVVNGTTYKDSNVLPSGNASLNVPVYMDLSSITFAANSNLTNCLKLGSSWAITRGGWDYYFCTITSESGKSATIRIFEGADFDSGSDTLNSLKNSYEKDYGADLAVGGNIMPPVYMYIDLSGFEGEKVAIDVIGVSNYGKEYQVARITNVNVPGILNYEVEDNFVSFVDTTASTKLEVLSLSNGNTAGVSFTVPTGEEVRSIKVNLIATNPGNSFNKCSAKISVYAFNGSYAESIKATPKLQKTVSSVMKWVDVEVPKGTMPAGNYLVVVEYLPVDGEVITTTAVLDKAWQTLPEEIEKYNIKGYRNGALDSAAILAGGFETVKVGVSIPENDKIDAEFNDTTAKVIVIAGQSNAAGIAHNSIFKNKISAEEYEKYVNGFSNVKILYKNGGVGTGDISYSNVSSGFVDVKIGQGYVSGSFGPELGLARYLAENYPDETFYIIKYAVASSSMDNHWQVNNADRRVCYDQLLATVNQGIALLEEAGLNPEILGFMWMQGEGDANTAANRANPYYSYQNALVSAFREEYAEYAVDGDIPFIDAEISDSGFWAASYIINDYKKEIDRESGRNYLIDTNYFGLTTLYDNTDYAHYDSESMMFLGQLYAKTLCDIYDFSK